MKNVTDAVLKRRLENALKELDNKWLGYKKEQAEELAKAIEKTEGNESLAKRVRADGLPKEIFVSDQMNPVIITRLSFFASVIKHSALQHPAIIFSWVNGKNPMDINSKHLSENFYE